MVQCMRALPQDTSVQKDGCSALANLAHENDDNKAAIAAAGGDEAVSAALMLSASDLRKETERARQDQAMAEAQAEIDLAGPSEIVKILKKRAADRSAVRAALTRLHWLVGADMHPEGDPVVIIGRANGCELVVTCMRSFPEDAVLQGEGCGALANLAYNPANDAAITAACGIETVNEAMRTHPEVATLQQQGCYALGNLAVDNAAHCDIIGSAGGVDSVLTALHKHAMVTDVQEAVRTHTDEQCDTVACIAGDCRDRPASRIDCLHRERRGQHLFLLIRRVLPCRALPRWRAWPQVMGCVAWSHARAVLSCR